MRLLKKVAAALNRSGSQLRKERKIKCDIKQIIRLDLSAFHIHQIADGAECVKGYTERHNQIQSCKVVAEKL